MGHISVPVVSSQLESLEFVTEAGAGPTDIGNLPCWQVYIESAVYLDEHHENKIESAVYELGVDTDTVVIISKDIIGEGTPDEKYCFWVMLLTPFDEISVGGVEYYVTGYNEDIIFGVQKDNSNPITSPVKINRSDVSWTPEN